MAINCYYINNNSFHGLQISNLNTQEHGRPQGGGKRGHLPQPPGNSKIWGPP